VRSTAYFRVEAARRDKKAWLKGGIRRQGQSARQAGAGHCRRAIVVRPEKCKGDIDMAEPVLLVNLPLADMSTTPFFVMPPGLLSIAAYLREKGETVRCVDLNVLRKKAEGGDVATAFEDRLRDTQPMLVGVSVMVAGQFRRAQEVCQRAKRVLPDVVTVVGGAHVSQFPHEILTHCPAIDFVVLGEGEEQAYACAQYARTRQSPAAWPNGLAFRSPDRGTITVLPQIGYISDVDGLPWPAYDLLDFDDYRHDTHTWHNPYQIDLSLRVPIITSRGCPNLCNFCSVAKSMGQKYRAMTARHVVDMVQRLHDEHGVRYFAIFDANFAQDVPRVVEIGREITRRNLKILLDLPTGLPINATAPALIDALAEAGLIRTCISVETGDDFIRNDVMRKGVERDEIFHVVASIRRYPQISLLTDFVMGMPEDTRESLEASCRLIAELDTDDITLSIATPYPGTALFEQCRRDNLFLPDVPADRLYETDWYSHANIDRFYIRPYRLDLDALGAYRDRILALRAGKIAAYERRMATYFGVDSSSTYKGRRMVGPSGPQGEPGLRVSGVYVPMA
jgi:anaerobic magnesium-protoporphyrin IX monomethyl ester cyclase